MPRTLLDTDTLSHLMRGRDAVLSRNAASYLAEHGHFTFSALTRYEILRGLRAKHALRQIEIFDERCRASEVLPLTDDVIDRAAQVYGELHRAGRLIGDADILIAATALVQSLPLVTNNLAHFERIDGLDVRSWRSST